MLKYTIQSGNNINIFLLKIMIPTLILIKVLSTAGVIDWVARTIEPFMQILGLPGESAIVWASTFFVNIYSGLSVFSNLSAMQSITTGQATVLAIMMLVAHNFFMEMAVAKSAGVRLRIAVPLRIFSAIFMGYFAYHFIDFTGILTQKANITLPTLPLKTSLYDWVWGNVKSLFFICIFVYLMVGFVEFLKFIKITNVIEVILSPILRLMGISKDAAPLTTIGILLGLAYGGGFLVQEAKSGNIKEKDIFLSIVLLTLSHAVIEDTILLLLIGADFSIILFGRLFVSLLILMILGFIIHRISDNTFNKHFYKKLKK